MFSIDKHVFSLKQLKWIWMMEIYGVFWARFWVFCVFLRKGFINLISLLWKLKSVPAPTCCLHDHWIFRVSNPLSKAFAFSFSLFWIKTHLILPSSQWKYSYKRWTEFFQLILKFVETKDYIFFGKVEIYLTLSEKGRGLSDFFLFRLYLSTWQRW